ncbi:RNA-dependent RNA polymerase [Lasius niger]|uniref:RNA-dependent RNA polymerase n=1 Tax=Lasius niger TaxID=67767 RepID=A0A0J7JYP0_LASNI|nr:RNA-dependent RNA polymerase [Lasius niger]
MHKVVTLSTEAHKDLLALIKDPRNLPLDIPIQPENYVKKKIKKNLMTLIVNKDIQQLFTLETDLAHDTLVSDLAKIEPCNSKLLNKLYALPNIGLQKNGQVCLQIHVPYNKWPCKAGVMNLM